MRPHQELIDKDERTTARRFDLTENLCPESVGWRRIEIRFGFVACQNVETALPEELPSDQIPRHPEAALLPSWRGCLNYLHWLASDDTHILIEGGPVDYFIFHPDGHVDKVILGRNVAAGELPVVAVPGGCWKALRLHRGASYALMANALSPEFTPDRVKIGAGPAWV